MSRIEEINLLDLVAHHQSERVAFAGKWLDEHRGNNELLDVVLRDHRERPISDRNEIRLRDAVDGLLTFYSLLEIACVARFVPASLPDQLASDAARRLAMPELRRYFVEFYPQLLPQAFLMRVSGQTAIEAEPPMGNEFIRFLSLSSVLDSDADVLTLLRYLDSFRIENTAWSDVKRIILAPQQYVATLLEDENDPITRALRGFRLFVQFCMSFYAFLEDVNHVPLFQSATWHYHAYWIDRLKSKIGSALNTSLSVLEALSDELNDSEAAVARDTIATQREAVRALVSDRYRRVLEGVCEGGANSTGDEHASIYR